MITIPVEIFFFTKLWRNVPNCARMYQSVKTRDNSNILLSLAQFSTVLHALAQFGTDWHCLTHYITFTHSYAHFSTHIFHLG